jgi:hypothetical protein
MTLRSRIGTTKQLFYSAKPPAKLRVRNHDHTPSDCSHWKWWASTEVVVAGSGSSKVVFVGSTLVVIGGGPGGYR